MCIVQCTPGQGAALQSLVVVSRPKHFAPPPDGGGLLQWRTRIWVASPHEAEQGNHTPQFDQPPFTKTQN